MRIFFDSTINLSGCVRTDVQWTQLIGSEANFRTAGSFEKSSVVVGNEPRISWSRATSIDHFFTSTAKEEIASTNLNRPKKELPFGFTRHFGAWFVFPVLQWEFANHYLLKKFKRIKSYLRRCRFLWDSRFVRFWTKLWTQQSCDRKAKSVVTEVGEQLFEYVVLLLSFDKGLSENR